ncbi:MAG: signal recognition particle subunit [Candelina submexicana]|nr:MAG: signal recognition particle subunit [Candelina submexicana]
MSQHARIEEVSDSDTDSDRMYMEPSDFDPNRYGSNTILHPANIPAPGTRAPPQPQRQPQQQSQPQFRAPAAADAEKHKRWQCIYPVYFDKTRSRAEGRRVGKELAVQNPLAREMVDAVQSLGLNVVFEPGKVHPKDWSNPGRVRVLLKQDGRVKNPRVKNKHHLYMLVSQHLQAHPTTESSPMRLQIQDRPAPTEPPPPPAIPRGWKMGTILPLHSAAMGGGGVSEDLFKEMMAGMQGQQGSAPAQLPGSSGGESKRKKEKKKGKA